MKKNHTTYLMLTLLLSILVITYACDKKRTTSEKQDVNILFLMSKNYGLNNFLMRDVFDQYGWHVITTGVLDTIPACLWTIEYWNVPPVIPDLLVSEIKDITQYDALIISTGSGNAYPIPNPFADVIESPEALNLIRNAADHGLVIAAFCAGSKVLAAADVINGKRMVGSPRFVDEYKAAGGIYVGNERNDNPPTMDGNIITGARGQYYNLANCQAIATFIESQQNRKAPKKRQNQQFIFANQIDFTDADIAWVKTYGGSSADGGKALCETNEGGFLIAGYTFSHVSSDADILVIKTDSDGNMIWQKTFGGSGTEYGYGCMAVEDGYLITGYTTSYGAGSKDVYLVKIDEDGNEIWSKTYGGESWDVGTSLCETGDGGYAVCGFTYSFGNGEEDVYLVKTDRNGDEIWSQTYGGNRIEMGNSVCTTAEGGFLIGATSGSFSKNTDLYLVRTDAQGEKLWEKTYAAKGPAGHEFDWCTNMSQTKDGGAILVGYSDCVPTMDICTIMVDAEGNEVWQKVMGDNPFYDYGNAVCVTTDGSFIVAGTTKSIVRGKELYNNDFYLARLDKKGNIVSEKKIDGGGNDWCSSVYVTKDGRIVLLGYKDSDGMGGFDFCLLKMKI